MTSTASPQLGRAAIKMWQLLLLLGAALLLAVIPFLNPEYANFQDRVIGVSALNLVDPKYRETIYILLSMAGIALATSAFLWLKPQVASTVNNAHEDHIIVILAGCTAANLIAYFVQSDPLFLHGAILAGLILALRSVWQYRLHSQALHAAEDQFFVCAGLSWQFTTFVFMLAKWEMGVPFLAAFTALSVVSLYSARNWQAGPTRPTQSAAGPVILWIALLPMLHVAATEISYFSFQRESGIEPVWLFGILSLLVVTLTALVKRNTLDPVYVICAALLVSGITLNEFSTEILFEDEYDLYHLGERILPLQQWADFSSLPFIDYLPIHGLFDALPHFIYQQLANGNALEGMIWGNGYFTGWLMRAIAVFILFHFFSRIYPVRSVFLLLWLLPTYHLIDPYFCLLLLPAIRLARLPESTRSIGWWTWQWVLTGALFLWRMDFGTVVAIANISIAIAYSWYIGRIAHLVQCFLSGALLASLMLSAAALLVDQYTLSEVTDQIKHFVVHQTAITSYDRFYDDINAEVITHYLLFPLSAVLIAGLSLSRLLRRTTPAPQLALELILVFLCAISLILSVRVLHRHSVLEGSAKNYLFLLVVMLFLIRQYAHKPKTVVPVLLVAFVMATYLFLPSGEAQVLKTFSKRTPQWEYPISATGTDLPEWKPHAPRLIDTVTRYDNFLQFMTEALADDQKFYDFSNGPMLYALAGIKLPVYNYETVFHSSDTLQHHALTQLERQRSQGELPFVVFRQNNLWDRLDKVDNALRSYRVAEYIYRHYRPCVRVDRFDLWVEKTRASTAECGTRLDGLFSLSKKTQRRIWPIKRADVGQFVNFGGVPYLWANYDDTEETIAHTIELDRRQNSQQDWSMSVNTGDHPCYNSVCYLDITIDTKEDSRLFGHFLGERQFKMTLLAGRHSYRIRLSALWHWFSTSSIELLELRGETDIDLTQANLVVVED